MRRWLGLCAMTGLFVGTPALAKGKKQSWGNSVYMRPSLGGTSFTPETGDPVSVISMGGVGGIHYWERGRKYPKLRGHARVAGSYVMSGGPLSGFETRLGNFIGSTWGNFGVTVGPDFFYNQYQYGATTIPGTGGVSTPLTANARMKPFNVFAGIEPAWYFNDDRERRNWMTQDGLPGFGHEFAYFAGLGVAVGSWNIGGTIRHSMTAYGEENSFGVSANFQGCLGGGRSKGRRRR